MANYGLLSNMADGIREGMIAYQTVSTAKQSQKQADRAFQMQKLKEGMQENPGGQIGYTPEKQVELEQERKNKGLLAQHQAAEISPESEESQRAAAYYGGQGLKNLPAGMSAKEYKDLGASGLLAHKASNEEQEKLAKMRFDAAKEERSEKKAEGKMIPASEAVAFGGANASIKALDAADKAVSESNLTGPLMGRVAGVMGKLEAGETGETAKSLDSRLKVNAQIIARYLEGGKISDQDIIRYKEMLPNLTDSPTAATAKKEILKKLIQSKQEEELDALGKAGYNVKGLLGGEGEKKTAVHEDDQAIAWAKAHPKDPRAKKILTHNGVE